MQTQKITAKKLRSNKRKAKDLKPALLYINTTECLEYSKKDKK